MPHYLYSCSIKDLFGTKTETIIGSITTKNGFDIKNRTIDSWIAEVHTLRIALEKYAGEDGFIAFEYTIPRVDGRVDCIVGLRGILFVMEFKTGETQNENADQQQLEQYVSDLKNFHFESYDAPIVPLWVVPQANLKVPRISMPVKKDMVFGILTVSDNTIADVFDKIFRKKIDAPALDAGNWLLSPYCPTPNIIEAARKLYTSHQVKDINRSDAKGEDLILTTNTLLSLIERAKTNNEKYLCLITGVPGAGKTLIGLSVATLHQDETHDNRSVYLSGNRPLVMVLQEALARDAHNRHKEQLAKELEAIPDKQQRAAYKRTHKLNKTAVTSQIKQFIQLVPNWRSEYLQGILVKDRNTLIKDPAYNYKGQADWFVPYDHVSIYDEAQRAWEARENAAYVRKKEAHLRNFPEWSEPRFLISCMDRHRDWAVYICLIGNGQDINHGEAGTKEWIKSIKHFPRWKVLAPRDILSDREVAQAAKGLKIEFNDRLHLTTDLRSLRAENLAHFIDCLLRIKAKEARQVMEQLDRYPIRLTRDLETAKQWIKQHARENERYGALASSKGQRLKPDALVLLPPNSDRTTVVHWFLGDRKLVSSSYYMEDVATEFQVQGLELDWALVAWDADLRYDNGKWKQFSFRGSKWQNINKEEIRKYQINAYRVILTRARRGMVIYVPAGNADDHTRNKRYYDGTYRYLKSLGIKEL